MRPRPLNSTPLSLSLSLAALSQNLEGRLQGQDPAAPGLTPRGHAQAAALGAELARRWAEKEKTGGGGGGGAAPPRPVLISSDLARATQTAAALSAALGLAAPLLDPAFRERHLGVLHGALRARVRAAHPAGAAALAAGDPIPGGGEGGPALRARVSAGLARAAAAAGPGGTAIIVSHGGAMAAAHWVATGRPPGGAGARRRVPNAAVCSLLVAVPRLPAGGRPPPPCLAALGAVGEGGGGGRPRPAWADDAHLAGVGGGGDGGAAGGAGGG